MTDTASPPRVLTIAGSDCTETHAANVASPGRSNETEITPNFFAEFAFSNSHSFCIVMPAAGREIVGRLRAVMQHPFDAGCGLLGNVGSRSPAWEAQAYERQ